SFQARACFTRPPAQQHRVMTTAHEVVAIWMNGYGCDGVLVAFEHGTQLTGSRVPNANRRILSAADERLTLGGESYSPNCFRVPRECESLSACGWVPELHHAVIATAGEDAGLRNSQGAHGALVAVKRTNFLGIRDVP